MPEPHRTAAETRAFLEHLLLGGELVELAQADPAWLGRGDDGVACDAATVGPEAAEWDVAEATWFDAYGNPDHLFRARAELCCAVREIWAVTHSPAARQLDPRAWFDEWVELPQPALDHRAPSAFLGTPQNLGRALALVQALKRQASGPRALGTTA